MPAIENKIPDVSSLVKKKTDYGTKISEIEKNITYHDHNKYITIQEFNKLTAGNFSARLVQVDLVTKTDVDTKLISRNEIINSNKAKHLLVENEIRSYRHLINVIFEVKIIL